MSRHRQLLDIVRLKKPEHIIEVGTWGGKRALEMMAVSGCYYTGFDLFEDLDVEISKKEGNTKRPHSISDVGKLLETAGLSKFCLIRGDTNETLKAYFEKSHPFDFAYIDGGKSIATLENDFRWIVGNISKGGTVIINGWYEPEIEGFGCNFIDGTVLPSTDNSPMGIVHLLRVDL